jgi:hypothetical protein
LAEALAAVDERGRLRLSDDLALVRGFCPAVLQIGVVSRESRDSVRVDSSEVREYENVGCDLSIFFWDSEFGPDSVAKLLEFCLWNNNLIDR